MLSIHTVLKFTVKIHSSSSLCTNSWFMTSFSHLSRDDVATQQLLTHKQTHTPAIDSVKKVNWRSIEHRVYAVSCAYLSQSEQWRGAAQGMRGTAYIYIGIHRNQRRGRWTNVRMIRCNEIGHQVWCIIRVVIHCWKCTYFDRRIRMFWSS